MVVFIRARIYLAVDRSNTLILRGDPSNQGLVGRRMVWECGAGVGLAGVWRK